jgi:hypothetical protein
MEVPVAVVAVGWVERIRAFTPVFAGNAKPINRRRWVSQELNPSYQRAASHHIPNVTAAPSRLRKLRQRASAQSGKNFG